MLFGIDESVIRKELGTKASGTKLYSIEEFLKRNGLNFSSVGLYEDYWNCFHHLINISFKFPVITSANYKDKYSKTGRYHSALICDGKIYDPSEDREMEGESYEKTFSKKLTFNYLIIVEEERDGFLKNFNQHSQII